MHILGYLEKSRLALDGPRRPGLSRIAVLFVLAVTVGAPRVAPAVDDPKIEYRTIRTPHFHIHYAARLEGFARRTARVAEEAHQLLVPRLDHQPDDRTHIVVNDKADTANGSANVFGRRIIRIFAMPPAPESVLGFYTDWLRILVYHEYAHILHLDTDAGFVADLNKVVGGIVRPNALLPRWYIEGLAVMYESDLTGSGRNYGSLFQTWLRTAALEGRLFELGTTSGTPISWPGGSTPYLYGGAFLEYIVREHGVGFTTAFNHLYGKRLAPFGLNQGAKTVTGATFHEMWRSWQAHLQGRALGRHVAVEAQGRTPLREITEGGGVRRHPTVRPGTSVVTYYHNGLNSHASFSSTRTTGRETKKMFEVDGAVGSSDWTPDGELFVYGRGTVNENVYTYQDLYTWNPANGQRHRLTEGKRARDPAVSPSGDRIAFVRIRPGTADLVVCNFNRRVVDDCETVVGGTLHPADTKRHWQQFASPTWTPDGDGLVVSWWRLDEERRDLWLVRFDRSSDPKVRRLTNDAAQDTAPAFGPGGLLYWSSDRTGIFNIYARRLDSDEVWQVSNVDTGVFQPCVTPNGLWIYAVSYTSDGYELARFPRPSRLRRRAPESYAAAPRPEYPDVETDRWTQRDYTATRWLRPLLVKPNVGVFTSGSGLSATAVGRGPVGHHRWSLTGGVLSSPGFAKPRGNLALQYGWSGGPFDLNLSAALQDTPQQRGLYADNRFIPYIRRSYNGSARVIFPLRDIADRLRLSASYNVQRTLFRDRPKTTHSPADRRPREPNHGWFNNIRTTISYSNVERYPQSISIERGIGGHVSLKVQDELLGADYESQFLTYGLRTYHPNPWLDRHVLTLRVRGGIGRNELGNPLFGLGGYRPQDVLKSVIFQNPTRQFVLRGYPPASLVGTQFQLWKAGYRFPLVRIEKGLSTVPIYLNRLKGEVFSDAGGAFRGVLANADLRTSVGAQLQLGTRLAYYLGGSLRLGVARGLGKKGITEFFFLYGGGF